jgi:hypothetical protein
MGWPQTTIFPISTSQVDRITSVSHWGPVYHLELKKITHRGLLADQGCKLGETYYWSVEKVCAPFYSWENVNLGGPTRAGPSCPQARPCWSEGTPSTL